MSTQQQKTAIAATELRGGNLVFTNTDTVVPIRGAGIGAIERNELQVYAIPLTVEWLEKLGFVKSKHGLSILSHDKDLDVYSNEIDIAFDGEAFFLFIDADDAYYSFCQTAMFSVHHLQNIYQALTGNELAP